MNRILLNYEFTPRVRGLSGESLALALSDFVHSARAGIVGWICKPEVFADCSLRARGDCRRNLYGKRDQQQFTPRARGLSTCWPSNSADQCVHSACAGIVGDDSCGAITP